VRVVASNVTAVAAGGGHTLVLKTDSSVWACGYSTSGALGDGLAGTCQMPARSLDAGVAAVASGYYHTLIVKTDGSAWACGGNLYGRLGDGTVDDRRDPVQVLASGVVAASAGYAHSLMVKADGSLWACGDNQYGQLGDGSLAARRRLLQSLDGGVAAAVAGERHTLIVKTDGSLWACGSNSSGQLGDGTTTARPTPVQILASGVTAVAGGNAHTLIVKTDGSLWACGSNWYGALGDGTTTDRWTPVRILASGVAAVAACLDHTLIVRTDGSLWGCGLNAWGELGDGNLVRHPTPVRILAAGVAAVATGYDHTLVLKTDGSVWTCGRNDYGQLGVGVAPQRLALTKVMTGALAVAAGASHSLALAGPDAMVVPAVVVLELDDDDAQTGSRQIVLAHRAAGEATEYQASENADFAGAEWLPYAEAPTFLLSAGGGLKTVYFRVRNAAGESLPTDDSIVLSAPPRMTVSVPGPAVSVGRTLAVTVAFSEAVTSFTARDVAVTNGTVTSFGGAEAEYRFALVPLGLGEVRLRVPAGICLDNAGYPNEGSEGVTVQCVPGSEPDDTPAQAAPLGYGMPHADSVYAAGNVDWFTFTLPATAVAYALTLETDGPAGDTLLSLYGPGNAEGLIEHDDDSGNGTFSRIRRTTWATALLPGTYYAKVEAKDGALIDAYTLALARTPFHSVNFSAAPNGRLVGSTQQVILAGDATTPVAAVPAAGYLFDRWSDGVIANPRVVANVATNLALTALFQPAAALRDGTYLATVTAAEAAAGHGLWDFTGHYEVDACGYLLSLDLLHDGRGRVSGSGSLTVASALIPLAPRGAVRGGDGVATLALSADGRPLPPGPPAAAALRLTLGLDPAARALAGPAALRLRTGAAPAITSEPCTLALSAPMDGSFVLRLDLACAGPSVRGTAELRLSNGVAYPLVVRRGHAKGGAALLTLAGDQAQPAARGLHFTLTVTPLEGGTARIDALTAQALGMALAW
jgi:alpha-tubulin suppressor-like RCC1 family protein